METIFSSERMNFIKPKESFAEFYAENINNPEIYRWLRSNPQTYTVEQEREWIKSIQEEPIYTMIDKETDDIVGNFGYNSINDKSGEIGIWITPKYQNNHYGREAIMRLIEYGFKEMNLEEITLTVFENNVRDYQIKGRIKNIYSIYNINNINNRSKTYLNILIYINIT